MTRIACWGLEVQQAKALSVSAGIDDSGAGSAAGPIVAAMVMMPLSVDIPGVRDSKQLSAEERERIYDLVTTHPDIIWST